MTIGICWRNELNQFRSPVFHRLLPFAILLALGTLWGGVPSISKYVIQRGVPPLSYSFWILAIATCVIFIINMIRVGRLPPRHLGFYIICGLSGSAIPTTCMYFSVTVIPASLMAIMISIAPMFTFIFALTTRVETYHHFKSIGFVLGISAMVLILSPQSVSQINSPIGWIIFGFLTPVMYAVNTVYTSKYRPPDLHVLDLSVGMLVTGALTLALVATAVESIYPIWSADALIIGLMVYHGALTATAFCLFYTLLKIAGPLFTSQVTYFVTVGGIIFGFFVHDEILPLIVWIATIIMLTGTAFIQKARELTLEN